MKEAGMAADTTTMTETPARERKGEADSRTGTQTLSAPARSTRTIAPPVDIFETDTAYVLLADMPGADPAELEVIAERGELLIRGRADSPSEVPDYQEFELGTYQRQFALTDDLDADRISATLREGVLRVEIQKSARVQPKKIPVRAES
jgi:HSP20 family protein